MNDRKPKRIIYVLIAFCLLHMTGCGQKEMTFISKDEAVNSENSDDNEKEAHISEQDSNSIVRTDLPDEQEEEPSVLFVYMCGEITNPGVYEMPKGARVYEAVEAAGGFTENACLEAWNQAAVLADGMQIYIPNKEEFKSNDAALPGSIPVSDTADNSSGLVNINTAAIEELCTLPGIGESRAKEIISYREQNGKFSNITEIQNVTGIKEGLFSKIKDKITI